MSALLRFSGFISTCLLLGMVGLSGAAEVEILVSVEKSGDTFIVNATGKLPVALRTAWDVLTDFDNMTTIMNNLIVSKITNRQGNTLTVHQEGKARYGVFSYAFESEREIRLEPRKRILSRQITGNARHFASEAELSAHSTGTRLHYRAEIIPDTGFGRLLGGPFIQHEIEEQLHAMAAEMVRRQTARGLTEKPLGQ